jgi:hypothetical protein
MKSALASAVLAVEDIFGSVEKAIRTLLVEAADEVQQENVKYFKDSGSSETICREQRNTLSVQYFIK